jgi:large subunit ribosomal protein L9
MKVILKKAVVDLGESGDVVTVKPGYARNYLLPQGLAYEASEANLRRIEEEREREEERSKRGYLEARRRAAQLEDVVLVFRARAAEEGKLFGSVGTADVTDQLNGLGLDFEVERRQVLLDEPLKALGTYQVPVRLFADVDVEVEVRIEREEG